MVIFVNEERAYLSWLAHHRHGFVLDLLKRPTKKRPVIHRAVCDDIKTSTSKKTHWTTGRHIKACSLDIEELLAWAETESEGEPIYCERCRPTDDAVQSDAPHERHLTKLGKDIVDYVAEAAVVCLDQGVEYDASVGEVADYLGKTASQITPALLRLVEDDYLRIEGGLDPDDTSPSDRQVYPTADALRILPAFEQMPLGSVKAELEHLVEDDE